MRVDQAGNNGLAGQVHPGRAGGNRDRLSDGLDAAVRNENRRAFKRRRARSIDDTCTGERHDTAGGCLRVRRLGRQARPNQPDTYENRCDVSGFAHHGDSTSER